MSLFDINVMLGPTPTDAEPSLQTADELLREMDRYGVAEALVHSSHAQFVHPREGNERLADDIGAHRDRLHPCWMALPPSTPELPPPAELVTRMQENGVRAVRLLPGQHLFPLSVRVLRPLLAALDGASIPVILDLQRAHWSTMTPWDDVFAICEAFPELPIILLREGGVTERALFGVWDAFPNLYLDTSYMQSARSVERICNQFGPDRLLFGSGLPTYDPAGPVATVHGSHLTDAERAAVGGDNARRLLGLGGGARELKREWPVGGGGFRVWDAHGHLGPWYKMYCAVEDAAGTVERMDEVGIERLTTSDIRGIENDPDGGNARALEACAQWPERLFAYATYAPSKYAHRVSAFERVLDAPGVVGIKLHCGEHQSSPDWPAYRPAYQLAHQRRLPVLVHGSISIEKLRALLTEFPDLVYITAHLAGAVPEQIEPHLELMRQCPNYYLDATSSTVPRGAFARLLARVPVEQVVVGSDFPIMDFPYQIGRALYADVDDAVKRKVLWENPCRIFHAH